MRELKKKEESALNERVKEEEEGDGSEFEIERV